VPTLDDGIRRGADALDSGAAAGVLQRLMELSNATMEAA
jgi:hypothetical protein